MYQVGLNFVWAILKPEHVTPWDLERLHEPLLASTWGEQDLVGDVPKQIFSFFGRFYQLGSRAVGTMISNYHRYKMGLPWVHMPWAVALRHPMIISGLDSIRNSTYVDGRYYRNVGFLNHPNLQSTMKVTDENAKIMHFLDTAHAAGEQVVYVAFGSIFNPCDRMWKEFQIAFKNLKVVWAVRNLPASFDVPAGVLPVEWSPQRQVACLFRIWLFYPLLCRRWHHHSINLTGTSA